MRPRKAVNHGDYGYVQRTGCKCGPCREARRVYSKGLRLDQHRGVGRKVPIARVRAHLEELIAQGVTRRQIIAASDGRVSRAQLLNIVRGCNSKGRPVQFVHRTTAASLLAVTYESAVGQDDVVPSIGIARRVQALNRMGHTAVELAEETGLSASRIYELLDRPTVNWSTIAKVHAGYERLALTPGTNAWVRWRAIRNEWAPPFAWEDDQLDDLDGRPDWTVVPCAVQGCPRHHWRAGLCRVHHNAAEVRGAFRDARRYREVVTSQHRMDRRSA